MDFELNETRTQSRHRTRITFSASAGNRCRLVAVATVAGLDCGVETETHRTDDERTPARHCIVYVRSSVPFPGVYPPSFTPCISPSPAAPFPPSHHSTSRDRSSHGTRRSGTPRMYPRICAHVRDKERIRNAKGEIRRRTAQGEKPLLKMERVIMASIRGRERQKKKKKTRGKGDRDTSPRTEQRRVYFATTKHAVNPYC